MQRGNRVSHTQTSVTGQTNRPWGVTTERWVDDLHILKLTVWVSLALQCGETSMRLTSPKVSHHLSDGLFQILVNIFWINNIRLTIWVKNWMFEKKNGEKISQYFGLSLVFYFNDTTSLCKTWWPMLSQHHMTMFQRALCDVTTSPSLNVQYGLHNEPFHDLPSLTAQSE